ncbi:4Fe-4S binding domain protein [delta proteobacterium NaphS2]|nr:4Fe-4S binding domain protein [delta proteobacterium NaphS2]
MEALGPLGQSEKMDESELKSRLEGVMKLIPYIKLKKKEKLALHDFHLAEEDNYADLYTTEEIDHLIGEAPSYEIDSHKCQGCMICARRCPVEAISGGKKQAHVIAQDKCIKCGTCLEACPHGSAPWKCILEPIFHPVLLKKRACMGKSICIDRGTSSGYKTGRKTRYMK